MDIKDIPCLYHVADLFLDTEIDKAKIEEATRQTLESIGENPERDGLKKNSERVCEDVR